MIQRQNLTVNQVIRAQSVSDTCLVCCKNSVLITYLACILSAASLGWCGWQNSFWLAYKPPAVPTGIPEYHPLCSMCSKKQTNKKTETQSEYNQKYNICQALYNKYLLKLFAMQ